MAVADNFLSDAAGRDPNNLVRISIRDFIAQWGAKRRGYWIVEKIERDLERFDLVTRPSFKDGWIDTRIALIPIPSTDEYTHKAPADVDGISGGDVSEFEITLCVGSLPSANLGITSITGSETLERAQSLMMRNDYSQLAVMSGTRDLRGAVSWESIARAKIRSPNADLRDAITPAETVRTEDDLLAKIPRIMDAGYVFVQAPDRTISGIVTTADLSEQFATLAAPFFLLAEIERRIRRILDRAFSIEEFMAVKDPADQSREITSVDDLSMGECCRLLEEPDRWERLGWALDRKEFVAALHGIREIRNEVMHFSPDPLGEDQLTELQNFLKWLRGLDST